MKIRLADIARAWLPRLLIIGLTVLLLVFGPNALNAPIPPDAIKLDTAVLHLTDRAPARVSLPHRWPRDLAHGPAEGRYVITLPAPRSDEPRVLLIPTARLEMTAQLDGSILHRNTPRPTGDGAGFAVMMRLPPDAGSAAASELEITLERRAGMLSGYLSPVYVATERQLGAGRWRWTMGDGMTRTIALAVHVLIVFAVTLVWLARRRDPIFGWLFLLGAGSLFNVLLGSALTPHWLEWIQPYIVLLASALGVGMMGLALSIIGVARPVWLRVGVVAVPALLCTLAGFGVLSFEVWVGAAVATASAGSLAGGLLLLGGGLRPTEWDRLFLAVPFFLTGCFSIRDVGVVLGLLDGAFLLTSYVRTLTLVAVLTLLMRRLVSTLNALDKANEIQRLKLVEQGAELSRMHQREQARMVQQTREEERERLTRDLHDGLSGHLVSIIAMSEQETGDHEAIERTAREALEDLRLVINSLDVEDGDLRLALAGFRERLAPRLRRLGVTLDWSMEELPEVKGVTPASALSILRILQEAVTNALKHGPARRIGIKGMPEGDDRAGLSVTNDLNGLAVAGQGRGLDNMFRRARDLGGFIHFERRSDQAVLTLNLPVTLTET